MNTQSEMNVPPYRIGFLTKHKNKMKVVKEEQEKDTQTYGYKGDEKIEITSREFMTLKAAVEAGIEAASETSMPVVYKYINVDTSEEVLNPSFQDLTSEKVLKVIDREATFNEKNIQVTYDPKKVNHIMLIAHEMTFDIHSRNIELGVAKTEAELRSLKTEN